MFSGEIGDKVVEPLTEERRGGREALRRTGATHRQRNHAHAVLLRAQGHAIGQLAATLGGERDAVGRWLAAWREGGVAALRINQSAGGNPGWLPQPVVGPDKLKTPLGGAGAGLFPIQVP